MLRPFAHPVACCSMLLRIAQSLKPVKLFSQQLPTFLLFRDRRSVTQQCWIRFHSSTNIVGAKHAHYAWFTKTYGLYPSHDVLQVPTLLAQQCWELLRPFAGSLRGKSANFSRLHCLKIPRRDLSSKKTKPSIEIWPESLGVMLEFFIYQAWAIHALIYT